jgi:hypothetical protein
VGDDVGDLRGPVVGVGVVDDWMTSWRRPDSMSRSMSGGQSRSGARNRSNSGSACTAPSGPVSWREPSNALLPPAANPSNRGWLVGGQGARTRATCLMMRAAAA